MKRYPDFFRPTLVRRIILTLMLTFFLVWVVLLAYDFWHASDQNKNDKNLQALGENLVATIAHIDNPGEARAVIAATSNLINNSYRANSVPGVVLMQLSDQRGKLLFLSPEGGTNTLVGEVKRVTDMVANGKPFRIFRVDEGPWSVVIAAQSMSQSWILMKVSGGLIIHFLIAFPLVLIPIWFAVSRGLRPLQKLSAHIASKGPNDLSVLDIDSRYEELKPLIAALNRLMSHLRSKIEREHAFVQDAAHELRTPMAVISAQAHVLLLAANQEQRVDAKHRLEQAIARGSHLIQQLLDLAHIDREFTSCVEVVDVAHLVRQELALTMTAAMARNVELSLEAPDVLHHALEVHALQSIVQNLLTNAVRYVQEGGQVVLVLQKQNDILSLSVVDDGPGISEAQSAMVFERFYRVAGHDASGVGLGLAIVKKAVTRMNGKIQLSPGAGGKGCHFCVEIPAAAIKETPVT